MAWPWSYSVFDIAGFELAHFAFSFCAVLLVVSPAVYWIWTTYRARLDGKYKYHSNTSQELISIGVVVFMVLLSLSVGLVAHVLEDIFFNWF